MIKFSRKVLKQNWSKGKSINVSMIAVKMILFVLKNVNLCSASFWINPDSYIDIYRVRLKNKVQMEKT